MNEQENKEVVDQHILAEDMEKKIKFDFPQYFLVKPLDPIMVEKEYDVPKPAECQNEDDCEIEYEEVEKEIKTVESDFKRAVVLKIPREYTNMMKNDNIPALDIKVGDIVIYRAGVTKWFDVLKDSQLLRTYDIIAIER